MLTASRIDVAGLREKPHELIKVRLTRPRWGDTPSLANSAMTSSLPRCCMSKLGAVTSFVTPASLLLCRQAYGARISEICLTENGTAITDPRDVIGRAWPEAHC